MNKAHSGEPKGQRLICISTVFSPDSHRMTMLRRLCLV
ncbi:hypothetical protein PPIS_b0478 [Pseudoalteromonas piscicida]|uniref:Uncharacterized protein n=1 Tax=Pseudoalteromonas piscicida TaxID=43662 RepID=A0ABM6NKU1_PSEO7|nr:hypothetical protein PPIS_b0478 [Pseudoalteromonas piscicida]